MKIIDSFRALSLREQMLMGVGIIAVLSLIFMIATGQLMPKKKVRPPKASHAVVAVPASAPLDQKPRPLGREPVPDLKAVLEKPWGRNPFKEGSLKEVNLQRKNAEDQRDRDSHLMLTGIMVKGPKKMAIINRTFLGEGDSIHGLLLEKIEKGKVILNKNGEQSILKLDGAGS